MNTKPDTHYSFRAPAREIDFARILREVPASTDVVFVKVDGLDLFVTFARIGSDYDVPLVGSYRGTYPKLEVAKEGHLRIVLFGTDHPEQHEWRTGAIGPEEVQTLLRKVAEVRASRVSARRVVVTGWE